MNIRDAVALSCLSGVRSAEITRLLLRLSAESPASGTRDRASSQLIKEVEGQAFLAAAVQRALERADRAFARARRSGLEVVAWSDAQYPSPLAMIPDPPPVLWLTGRLAPPGGPSVAIVGSRAGSPYALEAAERLAGDLATRGVTIVSGLARGVDSAAHRGALAVGGKTVAVLGSGADVIYPAEHVELARSIAQTGAVVSEFLPGTPPRPGQFPRRNRIISGMAVAVVVVEASERSGSLITAACALEQGRDVMVVPGSILSGRNRGSHALVKDGAKIVESADDILEEVGMHLEHRDGSGRQPAVQQSDPVWRVMGPGETYDLDTIAAESGLAPVKLLPKLLELELSGEVSRVGGGRFARRRPK